ncbi:hypothetical protein KKD52_18895 [Myxococcota bacterium]|nr:hypothetical protein [Myxococcota bacterium]
MIDLVKQLRSQIKERAASPLLATFVISWVLWNYRFLVILFSDASISQIFDLIDTQHFNSGLTVFCRGVLYPLLTTIVYIYLYPYPAKYVYSYTARKQKELHELKQKIEDQTPLTLEESRAIRYERFKVEEEYQERLNRKDEEIRRLKSELHPMVPKEKRQVATTQTGNQVRLPHEQERLLRKIAGTPDYLPISSLIPDNAGDNRINMEYNLGELDRKGLVKYKNVPGLYEDVYYLTHSGKEYIVKNPF